MASGRQQSYNSTTACSNFEREAVAGVYTALNTRENGKIVLKQRYSGILSLDRINQTVKKTGRSYGCFNLYDFNFLSEVKATGPVWQVVYVTDATVLSHKQDTSSLILWTHVLKLTYNSEGRLLPKGQPTKPIWGAQKEAILVFSHVLTIPILQSLSLVISSRTGSATS